MAGSIAWDCKKIYPHCAFTLAADLDATNLPLIFTHLAQAHGSHAHPSAPQITINAAATYS